MLPVTFCEKIPDAEVEGGVLSKGALPVKTWLVIETVVALAPCEIAQSPKMLAAKVVEWYAFINILLVLEYPLGGRKLPVPPYHFCRSLLPASASLGTTKNATPPNRRAQWRIGLKRIYPEI
jgi:hypothetical protein